MCCRRLLVQQVKPLENQQTMCIYVAPYVVEGGHIAFGSDLVGVGVVVVGVVVTHTLSVR